MSFFELLLYTMRHVQEHAAQLSLFLGQHGIPDETLDWVGRAQARVAPRRADARLPTHASSGHSLPARATCLDEGHLAVGV